MSCQNPIHSDRNPIEDDLGQALARTLARYGIQGYIVGISGDGSEISVDTMITDDAGRPLLDNSDPEDHKAATITWTAKLYQGGGPKR